MRPYKRSANILLLFLNKKAPNFQFLDFESNKQLFLTFLLKFT